VSFVDHFLRQVPLYNTPALQGVILQISDGIARVHGLKDIKAGEMVLVG
jgi:F0F1-type ATP synthase alpha subunit